MDLQKTQQVMIIITMYVYGGKRMSSYAKEGWYKLIAFIIFILIARWANATTYMGRDNAQTVYYVCESNAEVAQLLGYDVHDFDLSDYNVVAKKTDRRTDNVGLYVVMINKNDTFVVCYRAEEYDIFFYSWDFEEEN